MAWSKMWPMTTQNPSFSCNDRRSPKTRCLGRRTLELLASPRFPSVTFLSPLSLPFLLPSVLESRPARLLDRPSAPATASLSASSQVPQPPELDLHGRGVPSPPGRSSRSSRSGRSGLPGRPGCSGYSGCSGNCKFTKSTSVRCYCHMFISIVTAIAITITVTVLYLIIVSTVAIAVRRYKR